MVFNWIIKKVTKMSEFEVDNLNTVFKWKMPFFYSQEGVKVALLLFMAADAREWLVWETLNI